MHIRKIITSAEEIYSEAGKSAEIPLRKVAVIAVIKNPFANHTYKEDLSTLTEASEKIGIRIAEIAGDAMEPYSIESYGKASIVGVAGEQQHGSAMVTTLFGDKMRKVAGGGEAWIPSTSKRLEAGGIIDVPLAHKDALYVRSHYDTMTVMIADAPLPDEIAVVCCYANRGQLNARVGGLKSSEIKGVDGLR